MAVFCLTDQGIYHEGKDFTGQVNSLSLNIGAEMGDASVFGADTRINVATLKTLEATMAGLNEYSDDGTDEQLFDSVAADRATTLALGGTAVGSTAYFWQSVMSEYESFGEVGSVAPFSASLLARGTPGYLRGNLLKDAVSESSSGNGAAVVLGTASSTQKLYAVLHVFAVAGTLDVTVESDESGFASPTTRITFSQFSAAGREWATPVSGPISPDDEYRVTWTVAGGAATFAVAAAIA